MEGLYKNLIVNCIQMLSIPLAFNILYMIAVLFHKPSIQSPHNYYGLLLIFLYVFIPISIPSLTLIETFFRKIKIQIIVNSIWFLAIFFITIDELKHQPYDFGLIVFCIFLSVFVKFYLKTKINFFILD